MVLISSKEREGEEGGRRQEKGKEGEREGGERERERESNRFRHCEFES